MAMESSDDESLEMAVHGERTSYVTHATEKSISTPPNYFLIEECGKLYPSLIANLSWCCISRPMDKLR